MSYRLGIDIGSTTAKAVLSDESGQVLFHRYRRHNTEIEKTIKDILLEGAEEFPGISFNVKLTGTAGLGLSERCSLPFTQEVIASAEVIKQCHPDVRMLIDLGGEDSKVIFFTDPIKPDIRMNGNCAGGTGAFIDQMAVLLNLSHEELNEEAAKAQTIYPIASRCGVFAKTDIQNLIARDIPGSDIAASIYKAVAYQVINTLGRGTELMPKVIFAGGPLTFSSQLRRAFMDVLNLGEEDLFEPEYPALLPALGAALLADPEKEESFSFASLTKRMEENPAGTGVATDRLPPLFTSPEEFSGWEEKKDSFAMAETSLEEASKGPLFLGIDSGSTTTKIVLLDKEGRLAARHYRNNRGNPIQAVRSGLEEIYARAKEEGLKLNIARTAVTGYGEDLIQFAFGMDEGHVETIAHFRGARYFEPEVSFILDIGGQDMKALFIRDGIIHNMELNEACSSGCGSFIETFANSLDMSVQEFSRAACTDAPGPCDLGTRCTVFMNSRVKQSLREGATQGEISAGLAYSVIKNCFNKVLKLTDYSLLGDHVVVQGGTFRNQAILRATELVLEREVTRPPHSELMGAWGAALIGRDNWLKEEISSSFIGLENLERASDYERKRIECKGCENFCQVTRLTFKEDGEQRAFYAGNKCEKIFSNRLKGSRTGTNMHQLKRELLFDREMEPAGSKGSPLKIGIPRVLNMWDDFPFWCELFVQSGFEVVLSDPSSMELAAKGYGTVMSENICFPAKLTNGHIFNLMEKDVDRIFYPMVRYSRPEYEDADNEYNCPVVTGYPQVIESSINPEGRGIPFDRPPLSFASEKLIRQFCLKYLGERGVPESRAKRAFNAALDAQDKYREQVRETGARIVEAARKEKRTVMMVLGRPYHVDALISHKMGEMITSLGLDLITEDSLPLKDRTQLDDIKVLTQWTFPNRLYDGALWAAEQENVEVIQLNSFGCGPDALTVDEIKPLLNRYGKNPTLVKIDEITSPGSVKLRIRSLIESIKMRGKDFVPHKIERVDTAIFQPEDKKRKILAPVFSPFYTDFLVSTFRNQGYDLEILPLADKKSIETGLKYSNNDICYPATIVIGDLIKALQSGKYNPDEIAVGLTQTGGQCRASSYVSMLKKAMIRAGYAHVPVVTISTHGGGEKLNPQPGFEIPSSFRLDCMFGIIYADVLARLYYSHACREKVKGATWALTEKYIELGKVRVDYRKPGRLYALLDKAVEEFNQIEVDPTPLPKVGIVGEIYVKFNPFSNSNMTEWLMEQGIEPEVPPLISFFLTMFITEHYNWKNFIAETSRLKLHGLRLAEKFVDHHIDKANKILKRSVQPTPGIHRIRHLADHAQKMIDLVNQYGESWLIAGDIGGFMEDGISDVICIQPFGCIANHIIAKGMEKKMKEHHKGLNILYLDWDAGSSEVNAVNRLDFLVRGARDAFYRKNGPAKTEQSDKTDKTDEEREAVLT
ncbi:MAG: acyl-CoA dehydratase activase [Spirochaetales bacterium]|nr:acyl-CoA dehydratase activase [Spirochaetales bacterium]